MGSFADALRALNDLKQAQVVDDYAVAGAMALVFWIEPVPTFNLDVLVEGVPVRVVRPEYLVALYLEPGARTLKRRERAAALRESPTIDAVVLDELLRRFRLEP